MKALESPINDGLERGENPRVLEREQLVRLMGLVADAFFVGQWDPDLGGRKLEHKLQKGDVIPERHLRAWRVAREEVLWNVLRWARLVVEQYFAFTGQVVSSDRLFQRAFPEALWQRLDLFLRHLAELPCWVDKNLSNTVFGAKQNLEFWQKVFESGVAPSACGFSPNP